MNKEPQHLSFTCPAIRPPLLLHSVQIHDRLKYRPMWTYILKQASKILLHPEVVSKLLSEEMVIQHITDLQNFLQAQPKWNIWTGCSLNSMIYSPTQIFLRPFIISHMYLEKKALFLASLAHVHKNVSHLHKHKHLTTTIKRCIILKCMRLSEKKNWATKRAYYARKAWQ